jgi:deoxyribonuclease-4
MKLPPADRRIHPVTGSVAGMLIGAHIGFDDPGTAVGSTGASCVQVFLSDPQGWKAPKLSGDTAAALREATVPVYVHAPYTVNLASPDNRIRIPSRKILQQCCTAAGTIGARAVIVHGGHVGASEDAGEGFTRWVKALDQLESPLPVYLENTAGGDHAMARHFDILAGLWDSIGSFDVMGFCLDTCHAHAAGEELLDAVDRIKGITGRIDLIHGNDSKDAAGSGRDRHENLGHGQIDPAVIAAIVRSAGAPVICETPHEGIKDDIAWLRDQAGGE